MFTITKTALYFGIILVLEAFILSFAELIKIQMIYGPSFLFLEQTNAQTWYFN